MGVFRIKMLNLLTRALILCDVNCLVTLA